jgi:hypothetical protein
MFHAYLTAVNKVHVVQLPCCHREEPFRATPVPVRVLRSALELLLYKNGMEYLLTADCHAPDGANDCSLRGVFVFRFFFSKPG